MFWKKSAPSPATAPDEASPEAAANESRDLDAAIDTVVALMRAFGEHAFDTDNVRAEDTRADSVAAILRSAAGVDLDQRRSDYLAEGWQGFDEEAPAYSEQQIRDYRTAYGPIPPL